MPTADRQADLFDASAPLVEWIEPDVLLLRRFAAPTADLMHAIERVAAQAMFRHLTTPGGGRMSVAMTNCGSWGWHSDTRGYRYVDNDPLSGRPWPAMPEAFAALAGAAAAQAGFAKYAADACLINRYEPGARMGAHRDQDEADMTQPIVSVSIGARAVFLWYGARRTGPPRRIDLCDGDVLVWGRTARAGYHGVRPLATSEHALTGPYRYNLTFRRAR
ncbi:MAG TPA: DNA oxidative demethylase AlkB [Steroidobacteraceae bacterium]|nr:DNA oxidative demethylase AlkB [Steroidobacteraceae bacterium]